MPRTRDGMFRRYESPAASFHENLGTMKGLAPAHVVFNGVMGVLQSDGKLKARVGDAVSVVHSPANCQSYPHLIGVQGNYVRERDSFNNSQFDLKTGRIVGG